MANLAFVVFPQKTVGLLQNHLVPRDKDGFMGFPGSETNDTSLFFHVFLILKNLGIHIISIFLRESHKGVRRP